MSINDIYLTREGYGKLQEKLYYLKNVKRKEIIKLLKHARSLGDLTENAEYETAKRAQAFNEKKITELEDKLSRARIIDEADIPKGRVCIGVTLTLKDLETEEEFQYTLVSEIESDFSWGEISVKSPVGIGLLGHKENEVVEIKIPAGTLRYKILKISR